MISLLRRDPMLGSQAATWGIWGTIVGLNTALMAGLVAMLAAGSKESTFSPMACEVLLALILWFSSSLFLMISKAGQRSRPFDLALPIPARRLWAAHILALVLIGLALLALSAGVLGALLWIFGHTPIGFSMKAALAGLILPLVSTFLLAVALLQSPAPSLFRTPAGRRYLLISIPVVCLAPGFALVLSLLPPPAALLPLGLASWLGWRTYRAVPPGFTLVPMEAHAGELPAREGWYADGQAVIGAGEWERYAASGTPGAWGLFWNLFRLLYLDPGRIALGSLVLFPLYLVWGLSISGFLAAWKQVDLPQFSYVFLTGYLLLSLLPVQIKRLPLVDAWPVLRRNLFVLLMAPPFLTLSIGLSAGRIGALFLEKSRPQILYQEMESVFYPPYPSKIPMIRVPAQYCKIAWDGKPPEITSPWGESHPAWSYSLYRGSRIVIYSPFSTSKGGSPRFVALQVGRAIEAIYGRRVPCEEILIRYLESSGDGGVRLKQGQLALLSDYPDLKPQGEVALFPVLISTAATVWLIMAGVYLSVCRAHISDAGRVRTLAMLAVFAVLATMVQVIAMIARLVRPDTGAAFLKILIRNATVLPGGESALWILCFLWLAYAYWLVQRRFERIEALPGRPDRE